MHGLRLPSVPPAGTGCGDPGQSDRLLELLDGDRIGVGAAREDMLRWHVRGTTLVIDGVEDTAARLRGRPTATPGRTAPPGCSRNRRPAATPTA